MLTAGLVAIESAAFADAFARRSIIVEHSLADHPLLTMEAIAELADELPRDSVRRERGIQPIGEAHRYVDVGEGRPSRSVLDVENNGFRISLRNVQQVPEYAELVDACLDEVEPRVAAREGGMRFRSGYLFISAPASTTPMHFDAEHSFLLQVTGTKHVTVAAFENDPAALRGELEKYVDGQACDFARMEATAEAFTIERGLGVYLPSFVPHWVETESGVSVSFSIPFYTRYCERAEGVYRVNSWLRKVRLSPAPPGRSSPRDATKSAVFQSIRNARPATAGVGAGMSVAPIQPPGPAPAQAPAQAPSAVVRTRWVDSLEAVREPWTALAEQGHSVFATWEFASTWWKHFGNDRPLRTVAWIDAAGEPIAILPCYLWRKRPLRVIRFLGNGSGDILGPVCRPDHRLYVAGAVRRLLDGLPWWDVFVGENLPGDEPWAHLLGARVVRREGNPVLCMTDGFDEWLRGRSANFRQQVRARERRLAGRYSVRFRLCTDRDRLDDDLDTLFLLHRRRFGRHAAAFTGRRTGFHREFAHVALERGWLRLWTLELDGRPAASFYGFRYDGVESFYQSGREPRLERESLGTVMLTHAIRSAAADGVRTFALLRGHDAYKYRFATADDGLATVCATRGRAAAAALSVLAAVKSSGSARNLMRRRLDI